MHHLHSFLVYPAVSCTLYNPTPPSHKELTAAVAVAMISLINLLLLHLLIRLILSYVSIDRSIISPTTRPQTHVEDTDTYTYPQTKRTAITQLYTTNKNRQTQVSPRKIQTPSYNQQQHYSTSTVSHQLYSFTTATKTLHYITTTIKGLHS